MGATRHQHAAAAARILEQFIVIAPVCGTVIPHTSNTPICYLDGATVRN
jgi:hypothetical protein